MYLNLLQGNFFVWAQFQNTLTAREYLDNIAVHYQDIKDYKAKLRFYKGDRDFSGDIYYMKPNRIHVKFSYPSSQIINSDGTFLRIYVPSYGVGFEQELSSDIELSLQELSSEKGLSLLRKLYAVSYINGPDLFPLSDSPELVVGLLFRSYSSTEIYRELKIYFNIEGSVRRIVARNSLGEEIQLDFSNIQTNIDVSPLIFEYDFPPTVNIEKNFLLEGKS